MLHDEPVWTTVADHGLTQGYGHVRLMPDHVLGQWICIRRQTGKVLWTNNVARPNTVVGVANGVVIATERCAVGLMGSDSFDRYALDLETGSLLWTSHPTGTIGEATSARYWYPDCYDARGAAASPRLVEDGLCFCKDGRILDVVSGDERDRVSAEHVELREMRQPAGRATALYFSRFRLRRTAGILIGSGRRLSFRHQREDGELTFRLSGANDQELWAFNVTSTGYEVSHPNFHAFRLQGQFVYIVASEPLPPESRHAETPVYTRIPRVYHLLTLELERGTVCQAYRVGDTPLAVCQIEDVDERGLLLSSGESDPIYSMSGNTLRYFALR